MMPDLHLYAGYIAYPQNTFAPLTLALPKTDRETLSIVVRHFEHGAFRGAERLRAQDGARLVLQTPVTRMWWGYAGAAVGVLMMVVLAVFGFGISTFQRKTPRVARV